MKTASAVAMVVVLISLALFWRLTPPASRTWAGPSEALGTTEAEHNLPHPVALALPPGFRVKAEHPRLPVPMPTSWSDWSVYWPMTFIGRGTSVSLDAQILALHHSNHETDLGPLFTRLVAIPSLPRGGETTRSLAQAYDWLYARWTPDQRSVLLDKILQACNVEIEVIRREKLSPYNVLLYNGPLQNLMACALAAYPDDGRAEPVMAFANDLWTNRVLPVWRQVMGRSGGWHEGGEYAAGGIGQVIHQVPGMWRSATGEDLFKQEPALRGYLDFLIQRTQPDGRYVALGDTFFTRRPSADAQALAVETRHAAAYWNLLGEQGEKPAYPSTPITWPIGPAVDTTLIDMSAPARQPLSQLFEGIGTLFARSDWSRDATHVSFRAGDNYWSHMHLDQGSFTIYKGGELAIDSGLFYQAMTDHYMNYTYQSVAHNTLTITDPEDTVPAAASRWWGHTPKTFANDGGQRRIGSGWGVEEAPLDLEQWYAKRETYHTGRIERYAQVDGITAAVADITPAYTNALSGKGTFMDRTRRVERFWRVFAYDRIDDIVVVFDNTAATNANFRKRWLLHSMEWPRIEAGGFTLELPGTPILEHAGGSLKGWVLLPAMANIDAIGGDQQAFWVDGKNYDDGGRVQRLSQAVTPWRKQPGAWRLEVSPSRANRDDLFLVVMAPTLAGTKAEHVVQLLRHGEMVGAHIRGPHRETYWWFDPRRNGVWIDVVDERGVRRHHVMGDSSQGDAVVRD